MPYPQNLIRKRRAMDETLPDGSTVTEAVGRLLSTISRNNAGLDTPPPLTRPRHYAPTIAPTTRTSDIAATDNLPPEMPIDPGMTPPASILPQNVDAGFQRRQIVGTPALTQPQGFSTPDAGYQNVIRPNNLSSPPSITNSAQMPPASIINAANEETRPRIAVTPISTLANNYRNQPLETDATVNSNAPTIRPYQSYNTVPSTFGGSAIPVDAPVGAAIRPRITQSIDPLQRAAENYNAAMSSQPFFGQYSKSEDGHNAGDVKPHADKGFGGRAKAALKRFGYGMLRGEGVLGAGADAVEGAINPDINAIDRLHRTQGENAREYGQQITLRNEQEKIADAQSQRRYRDAQTQRALNPKYTYRKQGGMTYRIDESGTAEPVTDTSGQMLPPETGQPHFREVLDEDGVTKILTQWNPRTSKWEDVVRNGTPARTGYTQPVNPETGKTPAQTSSEQIGVARTNNQYDIEEQKHNQREAARVAKEQADADEANQFNATIDRQNSELKKQQDEAYAIANDPKRQAWEQVAARKRAEGLMKQIGVNEQKRKTVKAVTPAQPFKRPQLTVPQGGGVSHAPQSRVAPTSGIIRYQ